MGRASVWVAVIAFGVLLGCSGAATESPPPAASEAPTASEPPARAKQPGTADCGTFCQRFVDCGSEVDPIDCFATCEAELASPKGKRTVECVVAAADCAAHSACYAD